MGLCAPGAQRRGAGCPTAREEPAPRPRAHRQGAGSRRPGAQVARRDPRGAPETDGRAQDAGPAPPTGARAVAGWGPLGPAAAALCEAARQWAAEEAPARLKGPQIAPRPAAFPPLPATRSQRGGARRGTLRPGLRLRRRKRSFRPGPAAVPSPASSMLSPAPWAAGVLFRCDWCCVQHVGGQGGASWGYRAPLPPGAWGKHRLCAPLPGLPAPPPFADLEAWPPWGWLALEGMAKPSPLSWCQAQGAARCPSERGEASSWDSAPPSPVLTALAWTSPSLDEAMARPAGPGQALPPARMPLGRPRRRKDGPGAQPSASGSRPASGGRWRGAVL